MQAKRFVSENDGFHLFQLRILAGKTAQCSYENLCGRNDPAQYGAHPPYGLLHSNLTKIYLSGKRKVIVQTTFCQGVMDGIMGERTTQASYNYDASTIREQAWARYDQLQPNTMISSRDQYMRGYEVGWHVSNYAIATRQVAQ